MVAHVYYEELLEEILACWRNLPLGSVLHLTVPDDRADRLRDRLGDDPLVTIHPRPNRGRDIAPFIFLLNTGAFDDYDAVLKLHTKRSPHLKDGEIRRRLLFQVLAGEPSATRRIIALFDDPQTGVVGWSQSWRTDPLYWMENEKKVRPIAARMNIADEDVRLGFFEGSMFWFRPAAFRALRSLALSIDDFEEEARQLDATLHHAIERSFTLAAWSDGFAVRSIRGRTL